MTNYSFNQVAFASPLSIFSRVTTVRSLCRARRATLGDTTSLHGAESVLTTSPHYSTPPRSSASTPTTVVSPPQTLPPQSFVSPTPQHHVSPFVMSTLAEERAERAVRWKRSMSTNSESTNSTTSSNLKNQTPIQASNNSTKQAACDPLPLSEDPPTPTSIANDLAQDVDPLTAVALGNDVLQDSSSLPTGDQFTDQSPLCAKLTHLAKLRSSRRSRRDGNALVEERAAGLKYSSHAEFVTDVLALRGDPLESDGGRVVVFRGNPTARLMVVGEGPGAEEDRLGLPFVGAAGQLLDRVLRYAGFDVDRDVYVTNVVKRRPRGNRDPSSAEMAFYTPLLREEVRLVKPSIVILAGRFAMQALLPDLKSITKARGRLFPLPGGTLAVPVYHPAFLLRNPDAKAHMREDALVIRDKYLELNPGSQLAEVKNQGSGQR